MQISFTVPGNPVALKRHRSFTRGTMHGTYDPSKGDKADFLAKAMENRPDEPLDEPLFVSLTFCFIRPKSHFRTGKYSHELKPNAPAWHTKTPDADNLAKFVCDSLNGIFWRDDSIVCHLTVSKEYSNAPRTTIYIKTLIERK
jgi:Holliday junction resolvase RusA-like endonuclease